jgi:hypothetical protein
MSHHHGCQARLATQADKCARNDNVDAARRRFASDKFNFFESVRGNPALKKFKQHRGTMYMILTDIVDHIWFDERNPSLFDATGTVDDETLADRNCVSVRTVRRMRDNLREAGIIGWERRANKPNVYWVLADHMEGVHDHQLSLREARRERAAKFRVQRKKAAEAKKAEASSRRLSKPKVPVLPTVGRTKTGVRVAAKQLRFHLDHRLLGISPGTVGHTALVEDRPRRSVPAPASLLSCRPDPARLRCPMA